MFEGKSGIKIFKSIKMQNFYVVATPIGNLGDITLRAIETLKQVDLILCEDTRVTAKLLARYEIQKPLLSYHQRSKLSKTDKIIELIREGKTLALVTDAGTPGISDPGNELVENVLKEVGEQVKIVPIPGASALTAIIQVSGIDMSKFMFLGFPPHKKGRETFFMNALSQELPVVYYDSPHRFVKNLELVKKLIADEERKIRLIVGRELTKMFEEVLRGTLDEILEQMAKKDGKMKGEFVVVLY